MINISQRCRLEQGLEHSCLTHWAWIGPKPKDESTLLILIPEIIEGIWLPRRWVGSEHMWLFIGIYWLVDLIVKWLLNWWLHLFRKEWFRDTLQSHSSLGWPRRLTSVELYIMWATTCTCIPRTWGRDIHETRYPDSP